MSEKKHLSEVQRLRSRPCHLCRAEGRRGTEHPKWTGEEDSTEPDPVVLVWYECAHVLCNNNYF
ncbi:hypothetical protein IF655_05710 [Streptomyces sp. DSM 110735]|uniref:hypothetical protein n=1 Tax=Streptomyces sp. DSM 110735 TaxID=2775031 RepID=UPI0018F51E33|nr:hypothetical protein [Streptomyces sp. DSM 110735]MBJ7902791.1 hypothetical protein [Streptomyces sp. DSM 110735]